MLTPKQNTFLRIISYYATAIILCVLILLTNSQLKLDQDTIPSINNYTNYFDFILLSELACKICYVPDYHGFNCDLTINEIASYGLQSTYS